MSLITYTLLIFLPVFIVIGIIEYFTHKKKWQSCKVCLNALFNMLYLTYQLYEGVFYMFTTLFVILTILAILFAIAIPIAFIVLIVKVLSN